VIPRVGETALLERHARLLFDLDVDGRIVGINEPEADPAPRFWLIRGRTGTLLLARQDVPTDLVARVADLVAAMPAWDGTPLATDWTDRLTSLAGGEVDPGPAFLFGLRVAVPEVEGLVVVDAATRPLLAAHFPYTERHLAVRSPVVGVVRGGVIVAVCSTVRIRPGEGEAGVRTGEAWRGQGFARAMVARWREEIEATGRTPFYGTNWDNAASQAVARALHMEPFAEETGVS